MAIVTKDTRLKLKVLVDGREAYSTQSLSVRPLSITETDVPVFNSGILNPIETGMISAYFGYTWADNKEIGDIIYTPKYYLDDGTYFVLRAQMLSKNDSSYLISSGIEVYNDTGKVIWSDSGYSGAVSRNPEPTRYNNYEARIYVSLVEGLEDNRLSIFAYYSDMDGSGNLRYFYTNPNIDIGDTYEIPSSNVVGATVNPWGPDSETGGGDGTFDDSSDNSPLPELPLLNIFETDGIRLWKLNSLADLFDYLRSDNFFDNIQKVFNDPMESILELKYIPVEVNGVADTVKIFNLDTLVNAWKISEQFVKIDCGTIDITRYYGGFGDYAPDTEIEIYLPFIGVNKMDTDSVMGKTIHLVYYIDLLSGSAMAQIEVIKDDYVNVLYTYNADVSYRMPLTARNWTQVISSIIGVMASAGLTYATGGLSMPVTATNASQRIGSSSFSKAKVAGLAESSGNSVASSKPHVQKSGSLSGGIGITGSMLPKIIITRVIQQRPANFNNFFGYQCNVTYKLSDLIGYTKFSRIWIEGITATQEEVQMIQDLMTTEGVIF